MKNTKVTCDNCNADLTMTGNCVDYRLALINESISSGGGTVTAMNIEPIIDHTAHFCGLGCLSLWLEKCKHQNADLSHRASTAKI